MPVEEESKLSFGEFEQRPVYQQVNREFLTQIQINKQDTIVDLGSGEGLVIKLILQTAKGFGGKIFAVEPDQSAIETAKKEILQNFTVSGLIEWIKGKGEELSKIVHQPVDLVTFFNAIHNLPDKLTALKEIFKILKPAGVLAFNSAFTQEAYPGNARDWGLWKLFGFQEATGKSKRDKTRTSPIDFLKKETYEDLVQEAGFRILYSNLKRVVLEPADLKAIAKYEPFVEGTFYDLPGKENYSLTELRNALICAVDKLFAQLGRQTLDRNWFELIAQKPA